MKGRIGACAVMSTCSNRDDNVLEVLGVAGKEDVISNLLKYCTDHSASFRNIFLERICGFEAGIYADCEVYTRLQVQGAGVPDLVVVCRGQTTEWVIIENKLKAEEGRDQTKRYAEQETVNTLAERLELADAAKPRFVFLTLFSDQVPESERFSRACYSSIVQSRPPLDKDGTLAHQLASDWLDLLEDFYAFEDLEPDEPLVKKLSSMHPLDAGYLAFRKLIRLTLPSEIELDSLFRTSQLGRKYYGAGIAKPEWKSEPFDDSGSVWALPSYNRRIHIEPQYDVLAQTLKVAIHYETYPYHPVRKLQARTAPEQYENFLARRDAFIQRFTKLVAAPFQLRVGSNQLAKAEVSLSDTTVKEVQETMQELITAATKAIDQALTDES